MHVQAKQYLEVDDDEEEDETLKMADPALGGRYDAEQLRNMAWAAKLCVHASPHQRPEMSEVLATTTTLSSSATVLALHQSLVCMAGGMYRAYVIKSSNRLATMQCDTYRWCRY